MCTQENGEGGGSCLGKEALIHKKMIEVMESMSPVAKEGDNQYVGKYRKVGDIMNAVHHAMKGHGVYMLPRVINTDVSGCQTKEGYPATHAVIDVEYMFVAEDGSNISSRFCGEAIDTGDKAVTKALQIAMKYCLAQTFLIPFPDIEDGDSSKYRRGSQDRSRNSNSNQSRNGNNKRNGKDFPLTQRLFDAAKTLGLDNYGMAVAVSKALGLGKGEKAPKLIDIKDENQRMLVLAALIEEAEIKAGAHQAAESWLKGAKCADWVEFASKAAAGEFNHTHLTNIAEIFKGALEDPPSQEPQPDKRPSWQKAIDAFAVLGVRRLELEAAMHGKSASSWNDGQVKTLQNVYNAMRNNRQLTLNQALLQQGGAR